MKTMMTLKTSRLTFTSVIGTKCNKWCDYKLSLWVLICKSTICFVKNGKFVVCWSLIYGLMNIYLHLYPIIMLARAHEVFRIYTGSRYQKLRFEIDFLSWLHERTCVTDAWKEWQSFGMLELNIWFDYRFSPIVRSFNFFVTDFIRNLLDRRMDKI